MLFRKFFIFLVGLLVFLVISLYYSYDYLRRLQDMAGVRHPDVLLITIDTCRADAIGAYGNPDVYSPFSDSLSRNGIVFPRAYAPVPTTGPSHTTILTGRSPVVHRVFRNAMKYSQKHTNLAQIFRDTGYRTAAFVSGYSLTARTCGLDSGFEFYDDAWSKTTLERDAMDTITNCTAWLNTVGSSPFFVWLHLFDPHAPYQDRKPFIYSLRENHENNQNVINYSTEQIQKYSEHAERARAAGDFMVLVSNPMTSVTDEKTLQRFWTAYLSEVSYADHHLVQLKRQLQSMGRWERTLVILTSDHGEGFEHDYFYAHGDRLWETATHVPWIVRFPMNKIHSRVAKTIARHEDIFPTTLSICQIDTQNISVEGTDLKKTMELNSSGTITSWITMAPPLMRKELTKGLVLAAYNPDFKLISVVDQDDHLLFNLSEDPSEKNEVGDRYPQVKAKLMQQLRRVLSTQHLPRQVEFDPGEVREMEKLRSLGYVE